MSWTAKSCDGHRDIPNCKVGFEHKLNKHDIKIFPLVSGVYCSYHENAQSNETSTLIGRGLDTTLFSLQTWNSRHKGLLWFPFCMFKLIQVHYFSSRFNGILASWGQKKLLISLKVGVNLIVFCTLFGETFANIKFFLPRKI